MSALIILASTRLRFLTGPLELVALAGIFAVVQHVICATLIKKSKWF